MSVVDWEGVDEILSAQEPTTFSELLVLDGMHDRAGLGNLWSVSKSRADLVKKIRARMAMDQIISKNAISLVDGQRVPLVVYRDGQREVVGDAILEANSEGVGYVAKVEIRGDAATDILQNGVNAFSIGFAPDHIDEKNRRPARWRRRRKHTRK